jgi:CheY-like chemotaxis protein
VNVKQRPRLEDRGTPAAHAHSPERPVAALVGLRVLVVDDDQDTLEVMKQLLEQAGAVVTAVDGAEAAFQQLAEEIPDVLVSDIAMPGQDGYALIRRVRQLVPERGGLVPAAALTAFAHSEHRQEALLAGYQLFLTKPVEPVELTEAVAKLARRATG